MELIINFIVTVGIVIDSIILFFLSKKRNKELPQKILIVTFVVTFIELIVTYLFSHEIHFLHLFSIIFSSSVTWLLGPLIFLYIKSIFIGTDHIIRKNLIHFTPYITYILIKIAVYVLYLQPEQHISNYSEIFKDKLIIDVVLSDLYLIVYLLLSLKYFYLYKKALKSNFSNLTENDFLWIERLLIGYLAVISIDITISITGLYSIYGFYITIVSMIIVITYLGYFGINQSKILVPNFLITKETKVDNSVKKNKRDQLSSLNSEEIEKLKTRLVTILKEESPYLDDELTLKKLAEMIPTSDKKLSTLLNRYMDISFYDIINKYRVKAVKEKIIAINYQKYSLEGIGYECGFSSKSSFFRIFKKETGISPSEFKKQLIVKQPDKN